MCYNGGMTTDADTIVSLVANGMPLRDAATAHDLTVAEARTMIDEEAARCFSGDELRRQWLLEAHRLRELGQKYFAKAMGDGAEAANSAVIFIKASERLATLTGMNAPIGHAVQVIHREAPPQPKTSTEKLRSLLDQVMHISMRERELLDRRELDGDTSPEVLTEINELRAARGQPPLPPT